ncbi:VanZ family protein [Gaetbulibacter jejuensis]|uniref:VanZ-like domain-containing protein n=1 Tax=Gaetbulibacter jejuensis TaxID=584607 RepID=A0ABP3UIE0_9FLAO
MLKKFALILFGGYVIALTILSLINVNGLPSLGSSMDDKFYHIAAYVVFTLLCFNYLRTLSLNYKIGVTIAVGVIYGIIIEVLQNTITTLRTLDFYDVAANTIGILIGVVIIKSSKSLKLK